MRTTILFSAAWLVASAASAIDPPPGMPADDWSKIEAQLLQRFPNAVVASAALYPVPTGGCPRPPTDLHELLRTFEQRQTLCGLIVTLQDSSRTDRVFRFVPNGERWVPVDPI